uniref:Uncharacterized protein n=1 Tax=Arundo donax TaxID=35708 RepID=A0A0A9E4U8_ARUDO
MIHDHYSAYFLCFACTHRPSKTCSNHTNQVPCYFCRAHNLAKAKKSHKYRQLQQASCSRQVTSTVIRRNNKSSKHQNL